MCDENLVLMDRHIIKILHRDLRTMKTRNVLDKQNPNGLLCSCSSTNKSSYKKDSHNSQKVLLKFQTSSSNKQTTNNHDCLQSINQFDALRITSQKSRNNNRLCDCRCSQIKSSEEQHTSTLSYQHQNHQHYIPSRNLSQNSHRFLLRFNIKRFGEVLILGACLLGILKFSTVYTAPTKRSMDLNAKPLWVFPCNSATELSDEGSYQPSSMSKLDLLDLLSFQTLQALDHARSFKDEYVLETFNVNFDNHNKNWKSPPYEWLPNYKKILGQSTPTSELQNVELETLLKDGYKNLQIFAAALEQVIYDLEKYSSHKYLKYFKSTSERLHAVLCEFHDGMAECGIQPHPNVERSVMSDEFRNLKDSTDRNLRDWMIYREYIKTLEYIHDALEHLKRQHREQQKS